MDGFRSRERIALPADLAQVGPEVDVLALNEALDRLAADYPRVGDVVKLRFFAGMTRQETADALDLGADL